MALDEHGPAVGEHLVQDATRVHEVVEDVEETEDVEARPLARHVLPVDHGHADAVGLAERAARGVQRAAVRAPEEARGLHHEVARPGRRQHGCDRGARRPRRTDSLRARQVPLDAGKRKGRRALLRDRVRLPDARDGARRGRGAVALAGLEIAQQQEHAGERAVELAVHADRTGTLLEEGPDRLLDRERG